MATLAGFVRSQDFTQPAPGQQRFFEVPISNGDAVDEVSWIALSNLAFFMALDRTTAYVADAGNRGAVHCEMGCTHVLNFATVGRSVTETNHVGHRLSFVRV